MYLIPDQNAVTLFEETNFKDLYTIMKDTTSSEGGAIYLDNTNTFASKVLFRQCKFENVMSKSAGGALYVENKGNSIDIEMVDTELINA